MGIPKAWVKTGLSGVGILSDAFNLFSVGLVSKVMATLYPQSTLQTSAITTAALVGAVMGQLVFGTLADRLGRRAIFVTTISLVIAASLGAASCTQSDAVDIYTQLCIWLFILGFGVGGEYPLSATVTSEGSATAARGKAVSSVFAMQGVGTLAASLVMYILLASGLAEDTVWRLALALGALPGLLTVYWRYKMEESSHFVRLASKRVVAEGAGDASMSASLLAGGDGGGGGGGGGGERRARRGCLAATGDALRPTLRMLHTYRWTLVGTAGNWLIFDIVFYANSLFSPTVLQQMNFSSSAPAAQQTQGDLEKLALGNIILALIGLPGYFVAIATIDRIGRRNMQWMGFAAICVLFVVMAAALQPLIDHALPLLVLLYGLTFFFSNFGPNMTTYVIPAEAYPTAAKATCHGISAASGKLGAAIGTAALQPLMLVFGKEQETAKGLPLVFGVCAGVALWGIAWTLLFTKETGKVNIEDLDSANERSALLAADHTATIALATHSALPADHSAADWSLDHAAVVPVPMSPRVEDRML